MMQRLRQLCFVIGTTHLRHHDKKGNKKPKIVEYDSDSEMAEAAPMKRVEIIYEDTKAINGAEPNFKWGQLFHMLKEKKVP